ncbi:peptidoglycan-binding domain-containing protein [Anaerocolumna sp. MB42-C2]|uniref:peptidoglycan-binding domain-containing protein n=1 Tax=Anaerocolumna sp. MB42-C2 TaxID=3070997 RepID=UPI0027E1F4BD|nr:peptidoglycan-binding domain-containing protein [Anaerocolumna sp. MB42-C2]WMJ85274.1 peptidoglycan-binding domain-containing protein [Anaerocolumna sp. MB42-C2]
MFNKYKILYQAQLGSGNSGILQLQVINKANAYPIENAAVQIYNKNNPSRVLYSLITDISGKTPEVELITPPIEYSLEVTPYQPYTEYIIIVTAKGYQTVVINSAQVLPVIKSIQPVSMSALIPGINDMEVIIIDPNYLFGTDTPKVYENDVKEYAEGTDAKPVMIPEFITVHNGVPSNLAARKYIVQYVSYVKSVVCSQIYATWPEETIHAYSLVVISFSLNRIYTNWYKRQGYDFDITSMVSFDQKWFYGRNIYTNVSRVVDNIFNNYLSRPGIIQPILTQACRGELAICPAMISLWGSKELGDRGYTAIEILRYFFGDTIYVNSTNNIAGTEVLWPGTDLTLGSSGKAVGHIQDQLITISGVYRAITVPEDDGTFGQATVAAISDFQEIFNLPATGILDFATWYKISRVYARITRGFGQ